MATYEEITQDENGSNFTAESFLSNFRRANSRWWNDSNGSNNCSWVFRGHQAASWKLVPSAFRELKKNGLKTFIEKIKTQPTIQNEWFLKCSEEHKAASYAYAACYLAIRDFHQLSLEIGLTEELAELNDPFGLAGMDIGADGNREYYKFCAYQSVGLAQHHGIPTPFLDWTRKPEVAVHFASQLDEETMHEDLAVYALKYGYGFNPLVPGRRPASILECHTRDSKGKIFRLPFLLKLDAPAKNSYLAAQHGIFTLVQSLESFFDTGICPSLEDSIAAMDTLEDPILKKFILGKDERKSLRKLLDREGLTEAHLKPSFDSISSFVKSRWNY